jgi:hypothetical protein
MVRWYSSVGLAGALLMGASFFLPIWVDYPWNHGRPEPPVYSTLVAPYELPPCDDPDCGEPSCEDARAFRWLGPVILAVLVALVVLTAWASVRATKAWLPAMFWLLGWAVLFSFAVAATIHELKLTLSPRPHIVAWGWLAAGLGGGCALLASVAARARRRAVPTLDVTAFD